MAKRWDDDAKLRAHDESDYAHGAALESMRKDISALKNWRWFITGGLAVLTFELAIFGAILGIKAGVI